MSLNSLNIGLLLRKFYKNKGLTQKDFAKKIGYSRSYISEIINGRKLSKDFKVKFSNQFGFDVEELLSGKKPHEKVKDYDKEVALKHKPVYATSWGSGQPDRRKEDRRKRDQRIDDIKKKMMDSLASAFDETTTTGKECIKRSIKFLEAEVINYKEKLKH